MLVFLLPLVSALDTQITIKSQPNADITVNFLDLNTGKIISGNTFNEKGDAKGEAFITHVSEDKLLRISIGVQVGGVFKKFNTGINDTLTNYAKFNAVKAGGEILINVNANKPALEYINEVEEEVVEEVVEVVEEVEAEPEIVEDVVEENVESSKGIGGFAIKDVIPQSKIIFYVLGVIVILVAILFVSKGLLKTRKKSKTSSVKIRSGLSKSEEAELMDAERRIKEAEDEIKDIKGGNEISKAEKKLEEDRKALEKLKGKN